MLFGIYLGIAVALYFDGPVLPIFILGALMQAGIAYGLSKNVVCINLGLGVLMAAAGNFLIVPILNEAAAKAGAAEAMFISPAVFNALTWLAAIIGLAGATILGMVGPGGAGKPQAD